MQICSSDKLLVDRHLLNETSSRGAGRTQAGPERRRSRTLTPGTAPGRKRFWHRHFQMKALSRKGVECLAGVTSWEVVGQGPKRSCFPADAAPRTLSLCSPDCSQSSRKFLKIRRVFCAEPWPSLAPLSPDSMVRGRHIAQRSEILSLVLCTLPVWL